MTESAAWRSFTDKAELAELIAVLSAAVDRADGPAIADCYTEDSYDDHGSFKGTGREFAEMICATAESVAEITMHHLLGQSVFDVDGDQAWGETFFVMHSVIGGQTGSGFGRYIDYFRRVDGRWKVAYRRVVPDASIPGDDLSAYWQSSRDRTDPRYDRLTAPPGDQ